MGMKNRSGKTVPDSAPDVKTYEKILSALRRVEFEGKHGGKSSQSINDTCFIEIIGGHLEFDAVAICQANESLAHLARDVGKHAVLICEFDTKHRACKNGCDSTYYFNGF